MPNERVKTSKSNSKTNIIFYFYVYLGTIRKQADSFENHIWFVLTSIWNFEK